MANLGRRTESRQLYFLIDSLSPCIEDETLLSKLVGYSVIKSLLDYKSQEFGRQPKDFREIQAVYQGLEILQETCIDPSKNIENEQLEMRKYLSTLIDKFGREEPKIKIESHLMEELFTKKNQSGNIDAIAISLGRKVVNKSSSIGALSYCRNRVYSRDYETLEESIKSIK